MNRRELIRNSAIGLGGMMLMPKAFAEMLTPTGLTKAAFGKDFKWGVATAAYQIEGAWNVDGKGPSIWDTFTHQPKNIKTRENGDVACDFYNRYKEDIAILKSLNMDVFRFSLSWSRILPEGTGKVNPKGIEFYHKVIDECKKQGIEPWITLYHWDLPQALQDKGGWMNREVIAWFSEYVELVTKEYATKVKHWMVLNEPMAFVAVGHLLGIHAPGKRGFKPFAAAAHHATMCQAEGGRIIRRNVPGAVIGTTFSCSAIMPKSDAPKHQKAARKLDALTNRLFIEPLLGLGYPDDWKQLKKIRNYVQEGDMEKVQFNFDFIGIQNYSRIVARFSLWPPFLWANQVKPGKNGNDVTEMNWEVYPDGIYRVLKQFAAYKNVPPMYVTENGAAFPDTVEGDKVHDPKRVKFFQDYLEQVLKAKNEGVDVRGYFVWTLMDNFEWAEGFFPRFGLVHVDFQTQKRTIKDSGLWFREFLK